MARLPADPEGFIRANTALERPAMVPEFELWLATEYVPIWQATEAWMEEQNIDPPYWAFCWPGGQAIARYLLDNPQAVRGKRVIDFAAGSGVSSMAAAKAGAASVVANDIDALSLVAACLNATANGLAIETSREDWLAGPPGNPDADVVMAGDVCYEREMSARALDWLRSHARLGRLVLLGDPGRNYFSAQGLEELARPRSSSRTAACARPSSGVCCRCLEL
jgi:predicted nicotinamide N-methyase